MTSETKFNDTTYHSSRLGLGNAGIVHTTYHIPFFSIGTRQRGHCTYHIPHTTYHFSQLVLGNAGIVHTTYHIPHTIFLDWDSATRALFSVGLYKSFIGLDPTSPLQPLWIHLRGGEEERGKGESERRKE